MKSITISIITILLPILSYTQVGSKRNSSKINIKNEVVHPTTISEPIKFGISSPLRDAPIVTNFALQDTEFEYNSHEEREINPNIKPPVFKDMPFDPNVQKEQGWIKSESRATIKNYAGQNTGSNPPDCNGSVNSDYYFQVVNTTYQIFNKSDGSTAAGPSPLNSIFNNTLPGANRNDGDPIVLWDEQANKWLYAEFSVPSLSGGGNDYMLIAVSTTDDPTGTWWSWAFDVDDAPDYMKFGIWRDGYYMATNNTGGNDVYVFQRDSMIVGGSNPKMIGFDNPNRPHTFDGFHCILPLDNDGPWAPAGTSGQFITIADDGQNNAADELRIYQLTADWATPANSTFTMTQQLAVNAFSGNFSSNWENIPQPGTDQKVDGISTVLMYRAQYRNFNGTQKIVCNHTIAESATEAAIRWYELEKNGNNGWVIRQQSTYNPDNISRWNGSIAMNGEGEIGLAYSVSDGANTHPGIRYCGQSSNAPLNTLDIAETTIWTGEFSQTGSKRWGDYCNISVDPSNDKTFWYTNEYKSANSHGTRIAAFAFPSACNPPTTQATNIAFSSVNDTSTIITWNRGNGNSVIVTARKNSTTQTDPISGLSYTANAKFGLGNETSTGNYAVYKGTGTSVQVTGLTPGTNYIFNIYEFNTADNCYLTPGATDNQTTTGTAPCNICSSSGNTSWQTSTTNVSLNTINNSSGKSGYSDYTNISTDVKIGNTYQLSVKVNTDGNYTTHTKVWIDWNKDCDFDDAGEEYDLGTAKNVSNGTTSNSPLGITIPDIEVASITMRVSTKYNSDPTSCETDFDGEVEDYTINVLPGETDWIGNSTNWFTTSNWSNNKVPTERYIVTIPANPTGGNHPEIPSGNNAKCYKLTLENNANITVNGNLDILH